MLGIGLHNVDAMQALKEYPDKYFNLCIADPPYGDGGGVTDLPMGNGLENDLTVINRGGYGETSAISQRAKMGQIPRGGGTANRSITLGRHGQGANCRRPDGKWEIAKWREDVAKKTIEWDVAPGQEFFNELFRVSQNQIIWGANYFSMPPTRCFVVWRKLTISEGFSMAMAEYAWTSFDSNAKVFECVPQDSTGTRFHPTQKPLKLYEWLLDLYAKPGDKILDPMAGSGTCLVACRNKGLECTGFEIDEEYYRKAQERIVRETAQMNIYDFIGEPS